MLCVSTHPTCLCLQMCSAWCMQYTHTHTHVLVDVNHSPVLMKLLARLLLAVSPPWVFNDRNDLLDKVAGSLDLFTSTQDRHLGYWLAANAEPRISRVSSSPL